MDAVLMIGELGRCGGSMALEKLEERSKCIECGHRGATVMTCAVNFSGSRPQNLKRFQRDPDE